MLLAQAPSRMSYQAVVRNSSNTLVVNQPIGMRVSILQSSVTGAVVYSETHTKTTNTNGLVSIEIGAGTPTTGTLSSINWANGPYFIKTETDAAGGTNYTISGTSQLLSVPYALHAKTAENFSGTITETDPVYNTSVAKGIKASDTTKWNNKLSSYTETDPLFNASLARNITSGDTARWNNKLSHYIETDPQFNSSLAKNISGVDTSRWNSKLSSYTETDPIFNLSVAKNITSIDTSRWNNKLSHYIETDPQFNSSLAKNITGVDTARWNSKLSAETDPQFNASLAKNITPADTARWNSKLSAETDPQFNTSLAKNITGTDTAKWNSKQNQLIAGSGISITGNTISASGAASGFTHYIGERFGGGIIFYLWKDSIGMEHGLIVALTNQSTLQAWSNVSSTLIGASAQSSWDGLSNSNAIVGQAGHTSSAAKLCLDLVSGGQSDWYLPSIDELSLLWHSKFNVNKTLSTIGGATVLPNSAFYWSSTENANNSACGFIFSDGIVSINLIKTNTYYVRAVRAF
jgi:hypothetical protein